MALGLDGFNYPSYVWVVRDLAPSVRFIVRDGQLRITSSSMLAEHMGWIIFTSDNPTHLEELAITLRLIHG